MSISLTFKETMSGYFTLGVTDPAEGAKVGKQNNTQIAMHAKVSLDDLDRFLSDPNHLGSLTGTIDTVTATISESSWPSLTR